MQCITAKRARGRPRDPAKRAALLAAARALFLQLGMDAVTMDAVVVQAGVSRATLYSNFSDKAALLAAVILDESERIVSDTWGQANLQRPLEDALVDFGERLIRFIGAPDMMAFERLIAQAALAEPGHSAHFFAAGPGRARGILEAIIRNAQARGEIRPGDVEEAANDLMGLWQGFWRTEMQYGHRPRPDEAEGSRLARHGVKQFLRLYAAG